MSQSNPNPEELARMRADALSGFRFNLSREQLLNEKFDNITTRVTREMIDPELAAKGYVTNKKELFARVAARFHDEYASLNEGELRGLLATYMALKQVGVLPEGG